MKIRNFLETLRLLIMAILIFIFCFFVPFLAVFESVRSQQYTQWSLYDWIGVTLIIGVPLVTGWVAYWELFDIDHQLWKFRQWCQKRKEAKKNRPPSARELKQRAEELKRMAQDAKAQREYLEALYEYRLEEEMKNRVQQFFTRKN